MSPITRGSMKNIIIILGMSVLFTGCATHSGTGTSSKSPTSKFGSFFKSGSKSSPTGKPKTSKLKSGKTRTATGLASVGVLGTLGYAIGKKAGDDDAALAGAAIGALAGLAYGESWKNAIVRERTEAHSKNEEVSKNISDLETEVIQTKQYSKELRKDLTQLEGKTHEAKSRLAQAEKKRDSISQNLTKSESLLATLPKDEQKLKQLQIEIGLLKAERDKLVDLINQLDRIVASSN